jgi:hypothetical protein
MKFRFVAGDEFDMITPSEMEEFIERLDNTMKGVREGIRSSVQRPAVKRFTGTGTNIAAAAATTVTKIVDGPHRGFSWDIRRIAVTGQDSSAVIAGATGGIFRNNPNQPLSLVDIISSIPWKENYSSEEFTVEAEEDILVVIFAQPTGNVNGNPIFVNGQAVEYIRDDIAGQVVVN